MATSRKLIIAAIGVALLASLPTTALAVFPGNNGEILFVTPVVTSAATRRRTSTSSTGPTTRRFPPHGLRRRPTPSSGLVAGCPLHHLPRCGLRIPDVGWAPTTKTSTSTTGLGIGGTTIFGTLGRLHPRGPPDVLARRREDRLRERGHERQRAEGHPDCERRRERDTGQLHQHCGDRGGIPRVVPRRRFIYYARRTTAATESDIYRHPADGGTPCRSSGSCRRRTSSSPRSRRTASASATRSRLRRPGGRRHGRERQRRRRPVRALAGRHQRRRLRLRLVAEREADRLDQGAFGSGELQFSPPIDASTPTPYGNNSGTFEGNVDWARIPGCAMGGTRRSPATPVTKTSSAPRART